MFIWLFSIFNLSKLAMPLAFVLFVIFVFVITYLRT